MTGISEERKARIFARFAEGASTRQVAREHGIGNATAARMLQQYRDSQDSAQVAPGAGHPDMAAAAAPGDVEHPRGDDAELAALLEQREHVSAELAEAHSKSARAHKAADELSAERLKTIEDGGDATRLRPRIRDARDAAEDADAAADAVTRRLAALDQQIAAVQARLELARVRVELAAAIAGRDAVGAGMGERESRAFLAPRLAAEDLCAAKAEERDSIARVEALAAEEAARAAALGEPATVVPPVVSTHLQVPPGMSEPLPYRQAHFRASQGQAELVAVSMAENFGWLPPEAALVAAEREQRREMAEERRRAEEAWRHDSRNPERKQRAPVVRTLPEYMGASVSIDEHGNPLRAPDPERPRPQQVVRPGSLGFEPFPR
jgi:transposase-like protein